MIGPGSQPARLVQGGGELFLIERSRSAVYRLRVDPSQTVDLGQVAPLVAAQDSLGNGAMVGTPQFITWVPAGAGRAHNGLVILTGEGQLFDLDVQANLLRQLSFPVVVTDALRAGGGYEGNFYLLDASSKQIWKYVPDAAGEYGAAPLPWLDATAQQALSAPLDMAIDGYIFVLEEGGQITRFQGGKPKSGFTLDPVTPPLTQPVALAKVPPENSDLFVADAQRVLRFDSNGRFLVEYRAPLGSDWGAIQDIALDAEREMLYVLSSTGLHMVDLRNTRQAP